MDDKTVLRVDIEVPLIHALGMVLALRKPDEPFAKYQITFTSDQVQAAEIVISDDLLPNR